MLLFEEVYTKTFDHLSIEEAKDIAENYFKKNLLGKQFTSKDGRQISLTKRGFDEFFFSVEEALKDGNKGAAKIYKERDDGDDYMLDVLAVCMQLPLIIQDMEFESEKDNFKLDKKPDIKKYETYNCEVELSDEPNELKDVNIRIEVPFEGRPRYYFHYLD